MKVLVCGSRGWRHYDVMWNRLARLATRHAETGFTLVHGGAVGADQMAAEMAMKLGADAECYLPDWQAHGRAAGFKRNIQMLDTKPDLVIAFWDGKSPGTKHTINNALDRRINTEIVFG